MYSGILTSQRLYATITVIFCFREDQRPNGNLVHFKASRQQRGHSHVRSLPRCSGGRPSAHNCSVLQSPLASRSLGTHHTRTRTVRSSAISTEAAKDVCECSTFVADTWYFDFYCSLILRFHLLT